MSAFSRVSVRNRNAAMTTFGRRAPARAHSTAPADWGNHVLQHLLSTGRIQAKLAVSQPGDSCERDADQVADAVMRMPDPDSPQKPTCGCTKGSHGHVVPILRKGLRGGSCESAPPQGQEEEKEGRTPVMTKAVPGARRSASSDVEQRLAGTRATGSPLPTPLRPEMEMKFGHDLSAVRLHTDGAAARLSADLGARAFTSGAHIYFGPGQYSPATPPGKRLLAHELTHVIQQLGDGSGRATLQGNSVPGRVWIQRYSLKGFPPAKAALMDSAISTAKSKVSSCGSWWARNIADVPGAIGRMRYDYKPALGMCGWTFPASWYIEIGDDAFKHDVCCDLASTIAHEASHTEWYTEGRARKLECDCFGCSC
jgi:uncharacterized protein DUF4157